MLVGLGLFYILQLLGAWHYFTPHTVSTYGEYCEYLSGDDLYRRHNVLQLTFNCAAIRASTIAVFDKTLRAELGKAKPEATEEEIKDYLFDVGEQDGILYIRYLAGFNVEALRDMLTHDEPAKSCEARVLRSLFPKIRLTTGFIRTDEIDVRVLSPPCSKK